MNKILYIILILAIFISPYIGYHFNEPKVVTVEKKIIELVHDTIKVHVRDTIIQYEDVIRTQIKPALGYEHFGSNGIKVNEWKSEPDENGLPYVEFGWTGSHSDKAEIYCVDGTYTKDEDEFEYCTGYWIIKIKEVYYDIDDNGEYNTTNII